MSNSFKDRETGFENKFAHDEEMQFKAVARRNKLPARRNASRRAPAPGASRPGARRVSDGA